MEEPRTVRHANRGRWRRYLTPEVIMPGMELDEILDGVTLIIDRGSANSTMKWVLLWSLLDAAPLLIQQEHEMGSWPLGVVADAAIKALGPQLRSFHGNVLRQTHREVNKPILFRADASRSEAAWALAQWPVPRLQIVSGSEVPVFWQIPEVWLNRLRDPRTSNKPMPKSTFATDADGLPVLSPFPGAANALLRLSPLLKPAIEVRWRDEIYVRNQFLLAEHDREGSLERFLFPHSRPSFPPEFRSGLRDIQDGRCFWCSRKSGVDVVDHVVPWSRTHNDAVQNLVLTDAECNAVKSDLPISAALARRWRKHLDQNRKALQDVAMRSGRPSDERLSRAWASALTPSGTLESVLVFDVEQALPLRRHMPRASLDITWSSAD